jgi:hypothetical protein
MRLHIPIVAFTAAMAAAAYAQDYPKLKAGQWDMTINSAKSASGAPPTKSTMCIDDAVQREMMTMGAGMSREMCTKNEFKREGSRFVGNSECKIGESKIVSRSVMTLTGDSSYHTEINATYDPPFMGMKDSQTTLDGKYVGACRDGLVPGDFIGPNGQKFNVKGMASGKAPMMPPPTQPARPAKAPQ